MRTNKYGPHSNIFQIAHNLIFNFNFNSNTTSNTISTYIIRLMSLSYDNIYTTSTRVSSYATSTRVSRHAISTRVTNDILCGPKFNFLKMRTDRRNISEVRIFFRRTNFFEWRWTNHFSRSTNLAINESTESRFFAIDESRDRQIHGLFIFAIDGIFLRSTEFFFHDRRDFIFAIDESSDRIKQPN